MDGERKVCVKGGGARAVCSVATLFSVIRTAAAGVSPFGYQFMFMVFGVAVSALAMVKSIQSARSIRPSQVVGLA